MIAVLGELLLEWRPKKDEAGHALAETYSVLTRLPGDARLAPPDAAALATRDARARGTYDAVGIEVIVVT